MSFIPTKFPTFPDIIGNSREFSEIPRIPENLGKCRTSREFICVVLGCRENVGNVGNFVGNRYEIFSRVGNCVGFEKWFFCRIGIVSGSRNYFQPCRKLCRVREIIFSHVGNCVRSEKLFSVVSVSYRFCVGPVIPCLIVHFVTNLRVQLKWPQLLNFRNHF